MRRQFYVADPPFLPSPTVLLQAPNLSDPQLVGVTNITVEIQRQNVCNIYMSPVLTFLCASILHYVVWYQHFRKTILCNVCRYLPDYMVSHSIWQETVTSEGSNISIKFQPHIAVVHFLISSEYAHNKNGYKSRKHVWYMVLTELWKVSLSEIKPSASITYCVCILR